MKRLQEAVNLIESYVRDHEIEADIPPVVEGDRPDFHSPNQKLLTCPFAEITNTKIKTQGKYRFGYPEGAVIHFNAGRSKRGDKDSLNTVEWLAESDPDNKKWPYPCIVISRTGNIFQPFSLGEWGYHCGTADHRTKVGIELSNAGKLKQVSESKWKSWFGEEYGADEVRYCSAEDNIRAGWYHKCTIEQQESLVSFLLWLKWNNTEVFQLNKIVGHDQLSTNKNDPGGSIEWTIPELIKLLEKKWEAIKP